MNRFIFMLLLVCFTFCFGQEQEYWEKWDENYKSISVNELIEYENDYQKYFLGKINKQVGELNYTRLDSFKFKAIFMGESRSINEEVLNSIRRVFAINSVDMSIIDEIKMSLLFKIEDSLYWFPVQSALVSDFHSEIQKGDEVLLYCAFLNESKEKPLTLNNTFLISEFRK